MTDFIEQEIKARYSCGYKIIISGKWGIFNYKDESDLVWIYCLCKYTTSEMLIDCWEVDTKFLKEQNITITGCIYCGATIPTNVHLLSRLIRVGS